MKRALDTENMDGNSLRSRTRKTARSSIVITLSSDSDSDVSDVEISPKNNSTKDIEILPTEEDYVSDNVASDDEKNDPSYFTCAKAEKMNSKKELQASLIKNKRLKHKHFRKPALQSRFVKRVSRVPSKRKKSRFCSSYISRKRKLQIAKRTAGCTKSYFNNAANKKKDSECPKKEIDLKKEAEPDIKKQAIEENVSLLNPLKKIENNKDKSQNSSEKKENDMTQVKKRGRPKIKEIKLQKKRGRPRLTDSQIAVKAKQKNQLISRKVLIHKKGRPSLPETMLVKKRGRPRKTDEKKYVKRATQYIRNKSGTFLPFLQNVNCYNPTIKLPKCRECRKAAYNKNTDMTSCYCRFLEYRKLMSTRSGKIIIAGFLKPSDCIDNDKLIWLPNISHPPLDLNINTAKKLLAQVGDQFCKVVQQEKDVLSSYPGHSKNITWKRVVKGVREMCDVCETTLFNIHWVCPKCGFAACIDCYNVRKQGIIMEHEEEQMKNRDEYLWFLCYGKIPHAADELIMTQIIPANLLEIMNDCMHRVQENWNIESHCDCIELRNNINSPSVTTSSICTKLMSTVSKSFAELSSAPTADEEPFSEDINFINLSDCDDSSENSYCHDIASREKMLEIFTEATGIEPEESDELHFVDILGCVVRSYERRLAEIDEDELFQHSFDKRYPQATAGHVPRRTFTVIESSVIFKDVPHSWLCCGRLLLLHQSDHPGNLKLFQEQWKRGQPIMVNGVDQKLDMSLWHPKGFCQDFGDIKNDLVNCKTGAVIPNLPMKKFWLGFENFSERLKDERGEYMLLKLKDWPPGEDFSEKLPKRFQDLMKGLPLQEYTHRDGIFNLAGRLPSSFVRPDLGPKMYNAYGSALFPTKGTTNLHLDVSDAVNVMVYVGIPHDGKDEEHISAALKAIDEGGCDSLTKQRVRSKGVRPGALWHIYDSKSADKIREMLTKVAIERGEKLEAHNDPIHDQCWYLDTELRKRLSNEYGVEGYAIAQCLGDAVFIPAGAPHQVRNLHSCVKVAEDFVSPENIAHCFKLTEEFRNLSDTHTNHEDKLQIKNIIYHVVKDTLSHLLDESEYSKCILKEKGNNEHPNESGNKK